MYGQVLAFGVRSYSYWGPLWERAGLQYAGYWALMTPVMLASMLRFTHVAKRLPPTASRSIMKRQCLQYSTQPTVPSSPSLPLLVLLSQPLLQYARLLAQPKKM